MSPTTRYISKLQGKRLLVFGGSSGIGFGVAEAALEYGVDVVISSSNQSKLDKAIDRLHAGINPTNAPSISSVICNLADAATLKENITAALEAATEGRTCLLDHVVFTAGSPIKLTALPDMTVEAVQETHFVRVVAPTILASVLPNYIHRTAASSFTLTSGVNNYRPGPGWAVLASTGNAVDGLGRGLAVDLKPIRVNVVAPGAVHTELFSAYAEDKLEAVLDGFRQKSLTGTVGRPEEVAEAYLYFMKNSFATGTVLLADGGMLLS